MKKLLALAAAAALLCIAGALASADESLPLSGTVIETMDSGGYTYCLIEKNGAKTWVAVPKTSIKVGQEVSFKPGPVMTNFASKTLNKTFDRIVFSEGLDGAASFHNHGAAPQPAAAAPAEAITVAKAEGPNAFTIAELLSRAAELDKKAVVVRATVVKVSEKIMGKNWIHLKDGSGDGAAKIVVTSKDLPKVGDVVTAAGALYKDKDFGSGYVYAVIIEEASIK